MLFKYIENLTVPYSLYISVRDERVTAFVRDEIERSALRPDHVEIRSFPNMGRDIAPKIVGFNDVYDRHEFVLHLHSKKSPHNSRLSGWREYLFDSLVGSPEIIESNLLLLAQPGVGIVFPSHFDAVRESLNWGYDFPIARSLLAKAGYSLAADRPLEFPSGSMFWARSDALKPLLSLKLEFEDFGKETGAVDGTLAHAIERCFLIFTELAGYRWLKVVPNGQQVHGDATVAIEELSDIELTLRARYSPVLSRDSRCTGLLEHRFGEIRALPFFRSGNRRPRFNLIIPTINPHQTFGGVATAIRVFKNITAELDKQWDSRIIVADASINDAARAMFSEYSFFGEDAPVDYVKHAIIDMTPGQTHRLSLRSSDVFMASAWWNADQALNLREAQRQIFSAKCRFVYLIQDFEPGFYPWSSQWGFAESTYKRSASDIAIINSKELYDGLCADYVFATPRLLPYQANPQIVGGSSSNELRRRLIIFYGRPSVARNAFELIVDGLRSWQWKFPDLAEGWEIVSVGEDVSAEHASFLANCSVRGKLSLQEYSSLLKEAAIGISLMISPHPSYPPLEMAESGVITITNKFDGKNLASNFKNVINVSSLHPDAIEEAIERAVLMFETRSVNGWHAAEPSVNEADDAAQVFAPDEIARMLNEDREINFKNTLPAPAWRVEDANWIEVKPFAPQSSEVAIFVTHRAGASIKSHVAHYLRMYSRNGISILLVVAADAVGEPIEEEVLGLVDGAVVRKNVGYDFAAWAHALKAYPSLYDCDLIYFVNDSLVGPLSNVAGDAIVERVRLAKADVVSLTENYEIKHHLQSFFLAFKRSALQCEAFRRFIAGITLMPTKRDVIRAYEVEFSEKLRAAGRSVEILFPSEESKRNRTIHDWQGLLRQGMPFVKAAVLPEVKIALDACNAGDWEKIFPVDEDGVRLLAEKFAEISSR